MITFGTESMTVCLHTSRWLTLPVLTDQTRIPSGARQIKGARHHGGTITRFGPSVPQPVPRPRTKVFDFIASTWSPVTESNRRPSPYHACRFPLMASR